MRAVVYARYSSDNQRDSSIEDQVRVCRALIEREGWHYNIAYSDHAASGASSLRPGYQKLLEDDRAGAFEVVVAEALDRLSRRSGRHGDPVQAAEFPRHPAGDAGGRHDH